MKEKIIVPGKEDKVAKDIGPAMFEFITEGFGVNYERKNYSSWQRR
nr:MAG TPA: hypothetical protein [Caudoviricetes sp.]